jgi:hypothetical protein
MGIRENRVKLDINNEAFQDNWMSLDKPERNQILDTLRKLKDLDWNQVYRDSGLKWEKITSVKPPKGIDAIYSVRLSKSRRATAYRNGDFMCFLTISPDHDATYGKK